MDKKACLYSLLISNQKISYFYRLYFASQYCHFVAFFSFSDFESMNQFLLSLRFFKVEILAFPRF